MKSSRKQNPIKTKDRAAGRKSAKQQPVAPLETQTQSEIEFEKIYRDLKSQINQEKKSEKKAVEEAFKKAETAEKKKTPTAKKDVPTELGENSNPELQHQSFHEIESNLSPHSEDTSEFDDAGYSYDEVGDIFPSSFGEYVSSVLATFGARRAQNPEFSDRLPDDEELGKEVTLEKAGKYYGSFIGNLTIRFRISLLFLFLLAYFTFDLPRFGMLKDYTITALACVSIQMLIMLLSLDVLTSGFCQLFSFRFTGDTLALVSCIISICDAFSIYVNKYAYTPRCLISSISLVGLLWASQLNAKALKKSFRVPAISKKTFSVTCDNKIVSGDFSAVKNTDGAKYFIRGAEEETPDEEAYSKFSILILFCAFLFAAALTVIKKDSSFFHLFATILTPAVPLGMFLCYAMPYYVISTKLFPFGASVAGWTGFKALSRCDNIIVGDTDIFPESAVKITGVRVFADIPPSRIIAYAGCIIQMSGSVLAGCFDDLMDKNNCREYTVRNFKALPGGGLRAIIDGHTVLCGGVEIMRLMKIKLPFRLVSETSVLLAVDNTLCGIFDIEYTPLPSVHEALLNLNQSGTHPIFAVRDFNITPELIASLFDIRTDNYDFPPFEQRFSLAMDKEAPTCACICTEGLRPYINALDFAGRMTGLVKTNILVTLFSSFFALLLFFLMSLFSVSAGGVSAGILIVYMLVSIIPILVTALLLSR